MLRFFRSFGPAMRFLVVFIFSSFGLTSIYSAYLSSLENQVDYFTNLAARGATALLNYLGLSTHYVLLPQANNVWIYQGDKALVSVIEGCNGVSVGILFLAFMFAFAGKWRVLIVFTALSLLLIWLVNIARIAWLAWVVMENGLETFYWQKSIFTASIYAFVLLLWLLWIRIISKSQLQNS